MARRSLDHPALYLDPQLSWLRFNRRVLEEAEDASNPLLERVKFLAITASNLDEFYEVRMAGLLQRIEDGYSETGPDGTAPVQQRDLLARATHEFVEEQYRCWNQQLRPALVEHGIRVLALHELDAEAGTFVAEYCRRELDPLLSPVTVDVAHPFPHVINKALCLGLLLRRRRRAAGTQMGVVTVPRALPRLIRLPARDREDYIFLADLVALHAAQMYRGYEILSTAAFRLTRNSNLYLHEEESRSVLESVRSELHARRRGDAVRLEIESDADPGIIERLRANFELDPWQVFLTDGPVNLHRLMTLYEKSHRAELKFRSFTPRPLHLRAGDLFAELRERDVLLHHPFDSYEPVVQFIGAAATDPNVLSIKQTLYRTSEDSPIVRTLKAAAAEKEVTAVVELKARFEEASNIRWARTLEQAGVQVFHGMVGLKTHCKLSLLVRRDPDGEVRRYLHLGTGNYNPVTARFYTDLSLLTSDTEMASAAHDVFALLTANAEQAAYGPLIVAPIDMGRQVLDLIAREADHARHKRKARLIAKINGLMDTTVIQALYRAAQAGVEIDLIVRGICTLRPGVKGVSERIRVRSIVGRLLEHSRIFYFANGGDEEVYLGSADWMPRNLYDRVELMFPVRDEMLALRLKQEILEAYLGDTEKARLLRADGTYARPAAKRSFNAQEFLIGLAEGRHAAEAGVAEGRRKRATRTGARPR